MDPDSTTPSQPQLPSHHVSPKLKAVLLALAVIGIGALGYLVYQQNTKVDSTDYSVPKTVKNENKKESTTKEDSTSTDDTASWKTYTNSEIGITFKHPDGWCEWKGEKVEDGPISIPHYNIWCTGENEEYRSVAISNFAQIKASTYMAERLATLQSVYTNKSTTGLSQEANKQLAIPDTNAATFALSKPEYVQNSDGTLRGAFYFAAIGQDQTGEMSLITVLTDNKDKVIEFSIFSRKESNKFISEYKPRIDAIGENIWQDRENVFKEFYSYVKTITSATTSENIVKNFASTYKKVIGSIQLTK